MKNFSQVTQCALVLLMLGILTSCGGGGSQSTTDVPTKIIVPPVEKCTYVESGENNGVPYSLSAESEYSGDIKFNCSYDGSLPTAQQYFLINGVPSLNVVELNRDTTIMSDCTRGSEVFKDTLVVNFDYKTGVVNTVSQSSVNGESSCSTTYVSPLETTLSSQDSIKLLFSTWGVDVSEVNKDKTGLIQTSCPQTQSTRSYTNGVPVCTVVIEDKYTLTDDSGKVHTIEKKLSY